MFADKSQTQILVKKKTVLQTDPKPADFRQMVQLNEEAESAEDTSTNWILKNVVLWSISPITYLISNLMLKSYRTSIDLNFGTEVKERVERFTECDYVVKHKLWDEGQVLVLSDGTQISPMDVIRDDEHQLWLVKSFEQDFSPHVEALFEHCVYAEFDRLTRG